MDKKWEALRAYMIERLSKPVALFFEGEDAPQVCNFTREPMHCSTMTCLLQASPALSSYQSFALGLL